MAAEPAASESRPDGDDQARADLEQQRTRALQSLQLACDPRRRAELERRIEDLDSALRSLVLRI